jgi:pimeloyl-ACP methyl ester carboxylesterase
MLGYGGSSKPTDAKEYTSKKLCADLAALLDVLGVRRAVRDSIIRLSFLDFINNCP